MDINLLIPNDRWIFVGTEYKNRPWVTDKGLPLINERCLIVYDVNKNYEPNPFWSWQAAVYSKQHHEFIIDKNTIIQENDILCWVRLDEGHCLYSHI